MCADCEEKIEIFQTPTHIQNSKIERVYCATEYKETLAADLIYDLKYKFIKEIKNDLAKIIFKHLKTSGFQKNSDQVLIPVPLHKKRLRWRGFNQSELLANEISARFGIPVASNVLFRERYTEPQTLSQSRKERVENMKNAFSCRNADEIKNKEVILVDDVLTTGATLNECAKAISRHNPKNIIAIVIAK